MSHRRGPPRLLPLPLPPPCRRRSDFASRRCPQPARSASPRQRATTTSPRHDGAPRPSTRRRAGVFLPSLAPAQTVPRSASPPPAPRWCWQCSNRSAGWWRGDDAGPYPSARLAPMRYVNFGATGLRVSRICLGMMGFSNTSERAWVVDEEAAEPIVRAAVEGGVTFFDTANSYSGGGSEVATGRL